MSDKFLPPEGLSEGGIGGRSERRAFLRRAVAVGVPVVLATVRGRSVLANDVVIDPANQTLEGSGCLSFAPSGWLSRGDSLDDNNQRLQSCQDFANPDAGATTDPVTEPPADSLLAPQEDGAKKP